jgi:hypothetical protein
MVPAINYKLLLGARKVGVLSYRIGEFDTAVKNKNSEFLTEVKSKNK